MGLVYHKAVTVVRQDLPGESSGRVNQKRRTRSAIIAAAQAIVEQGATPTVAQAAEDALVSRTTAYRYFPTQESLLLELSINIDVREVEELVARPLAGTTPQDRLVEFVDLFNRHVLANESSTAPAPATTWTCGSPHNAPATTTPTPVKAVAPA